VLAVQRLPDHSPGFLPLTVPFYAECNHGLMPSPRWSAEAIEETISE
jgi:hypothetical protein